MQSFLATMQNMLNAASNISSIKVVCCFVCDGMNRPLMHV